MHVLRGQGHNRQTTSLSGGDCRYMVAHRQEPQQKVTKDKVSFVRYTEHTRGAQCQSKHSILEMYISRPWRQIRSREEGTAGHTVGYGEVGRADSLGIVSAVSQPSASGHSRRLKCG